MSTLRYMPWDVLGNGQKRLGDVSTERVKGAAYAHWRIEMMTASPPRLSISPVRFAFR